MSRRRSAAFTAPRTDRKPRGRWFEESAWNPAEDATPEIEYSPHTGAALAQDLLEPMLRQRCARAGSSRAQRGAAIDGEVVVGQGERHQPGTGWDRQMHRADADLSRLSDGGEAVQNPFQALSAEGAIQKEH